MAAITTRQTAGTGATVAGVPLTNAQLDQNFINLNTAVVDAAANTTVTPGAYTNTNLTVDARGRITTATSGVAGGVTAVTATTPVVSSGGTTPVISIPVATTSASGYLSSTDWTTFNNKLGAASDTLATVTARGATTTATPTFSKGLIAGNSVPFYHLSLDFNSDAAGSWRVIGTIALANNTYSTAAYKITITDPNANYGNIASVDADEYTYYVACVRTETTTIDFPDLCVVRGPYSHIRAVKTSTGNYQIQVSNEQQYQEYLVTIQCYANNVNANAITFLDGTTTGGAGTAVYAASVGAATQHFQKINTLGSATIQGLTVGRGIGGYNTNTALGVSTLNTAGVSQYNTAVGYQTLTNNSTGSFNTGVGGSVFTGYSTGSYNSALGYQALTGITTGTSNIGIGYFAGYSLTTGSNNTIIGSVAGTAGLSDTVIIAAGSAERMRIDSSSNTSFYNSVSVGKAGSIDINYSFGVNSVSAAAVGFNNSGSTNAYGAATGTTYFGMAQGFPIVFTTSAATRMTIGATGAVSISGALTVAGDTTLAAYTETIVASNTVGASATLAITAGTVLTATLTSATPCTFTMPTATAGKSFTLLLKQPASGTATTATFTNVKWAGSGAPTITATVGKMDILTFVADGTNWYGSYTQGYTP